MNGRGMAAPAVDAARVTLARLGARAMAETLTIAAGRPGLLPSEREDLRALARELQRVAS